MKKNNIILLFATFIYLAIFSYRYIVAKNYEFMWYILIMLIILTVVVSTLKKTKFPSWILWGMSLWGFMHLAGGNIWIAGDVLYAYVFLPIITSGELIFLRFDQFVHAYLYFLVVFIIYHLVKPHLKTKFNKAIVFIVIALASMGAASINEIIEFLMVVSLEKQGVGGYYNTAMDIIANAIGAVIGAAILYLREN